MCRALGFTRACTVIVQGPDRRFYTGPRPADGLKWASKLSRMALGRATASGRLRVESEERHSQEPRRDKPDHRPAAALE
jgi:hypothetical protein